MMNLISFETPPLGRQERVNTTTIRANKEASSSSNNCFHSHLDLSLGISLSPGGGSGSGCEAAGCGSSAASYGGCRVGSHGDKEAVVCGIATATITTADVLSAGHSHGGELVAAGGGWTAAFMPSPTGFMHPWSLAARQQKAAAEQERSPAATYMASDTGRVVPLASAVGWPPVHTSRRNLVTAMQAATKPAGAAAVDGPLKAAAAPAAGGKKNAVAPAPAPPTDSTVVATRPPPTSMFAKVQMEGCSIGRKINLRAHGSYDSLSRVLTKMTRNFFCPADCSGASTGEDFPSSDTFIFLYEDFEGDRMLVGDVPWELFLASAKRLYIVRNPTLGGKGRGDDEKIDITEEATNN